MSLQPITTVNISLNTTGVSRKGFGTPIFISAHNFFEERVRSYTNLDSVAEDFPAGTNGYIAAQSFFSQSPSVSQLKIGRRDSELQVTPLDVADGVNYLITVSSGIDSLNISVTAGLAETEQDVCEGIKTAIDGNAGLAAAITTSVVGIGSAAVLTLVKIGTSEFSVSALTDNLATVSTSTELPATVLQECLDEDNDFYFVTADDHTEAFVLAMAQDVEARYLMYFVGNQDSTALVVLGDPATDTLGKLKENNYLRTVTFWHHQADIKFNECSYVGFNAPFNGGSVTWANLQLKGVSRSSDPTTGKKLSATQLNNLKARNANFTVDSGFGTGQDSDVTIVRSGVTVSGEWIDVVRGSDNLKFDMEANIQNLLINQQGGKVAYNDTGLNSVRSVINTTLDVYVDRVFIGSNYVVTIPRAVDISFQDKASGILSNASFEATLEGAIHIIKINGTLGY